MNNRLPSVILACVLLWWWSTPRISSTLDNESLDERFKHNLWLRLANITHVTSFCLMISSDLHTMLGSCLIPVCKDPNDIHNDTQLPYIGEKWTYESSINWGKITKHLPPDALELYTPHVANLENNTCAKIVNCKDQCRKLPKGQWTCNNLTNISYNWAHIILPLGWFFTCGTTTFNYIPANISECTCCLSRLVPILPSKPSKVKQLLKSRRTRDSTLVSLTPECDGNVSLLNRYETTALAVALVGVPGMAMHAENQLTKLACNLAKSINATSHAIALLNQEQAALRNAIVNNRGAIDFLLLQHRYGCEVMPDMCCFNLTDNSLAIDQQIQKLKTFAASIHIDAGSNTNIWDSLWSIFPVGWIRSLCQYAIIIIGILIAVCCFVQCIPNLIQTFQRCITHRITTNITHHDSHYAVMAPGHTETNYAVMVPAVIETNYDNVIVETVIE
ncbi:uncharacterized protein LOC115099520 isoform X1 [Rhinatrema bivittatum]|uniref:uncharacterized protein LOC115099520 isoform X1 n=1 Tax=Rhinatrema bivittatum TaxID=194408 RepID=UPI00112A5A4F|nr:uncharacterized protein LOC115099520 isoform X1 [Rhinatrema bivittatum]